MFGHALDASRIEQVGIVFKPGRGLLIGRGDFQGKIKIPGLVNIDPLFSSSARPWLQSHGNFIESQDLKKSSYISVLSGTVP